MEPYKNENRECECWLCELAATCQYVDKYQRLPRDKAPGALGLCKKLKNTNKEFVVIPDEENKTISICPMVDGQTTIKLTVETAKVLIEILNHQIQECK